MSEELTWTDDGWRHHLRAQGHRWRWTAQYMVPNESGELPPPHDLGVVPGGSFVAIQRLVASRSQRQEGT